MAGFRLDHLAICARTLDEGVAWAEEKFGVPLQAGGKHDRYGTHNRLLGLDGALYLEVIAADPEASPDRPRWFGLDYFDGPPRLANWICEPSDLDDWLVHGMQSVPMKRGDLRWDMGVPADGSLPMGGGFPTLLRWHTDAPPGVLLASSGFRLERLTVNHPEAARIQAELSGALVDQRITFHTAQSISLSASFLNQGRRVTL